MTTRESVMAVTSSSVGVVAGSNVREWYRVALKGSASPSMTLVATSPAPAWWISDVLPCSSSGARTITPSYASPAFAVTWSLRQVEDEAVVVVEQENH